MTKNILLNELEQQILPFWINNINPTTGCYYSEVQNDLTVKHNKPVSTTMLYRYLWSFSSAYLYLHDKRLLNIANKIYQFVKKYSFDSHSGGVVWSLTENGETIDYTKHLYAQAFAIYGLTEYYKITADKEVLHDALDIYHLIEKKAKNPQGGFFEQFSYEWKKDSENRIGFKGKDSLTTNTHLHLLEALSNLYEVYSDKLVYQSCQELLTLFKKYIFTSEGYCHQFFNLYWENIDSTISYGHDIETSWLLHTACVKLNINDSLLNKQLSRLCDYCLENGVDSSTGILYENNHHTFYTWWVLAESCIGFLHAFQLSNNKKYINLYEQHFNFIHNYFLSHTGEWYAYLHNDLSIVEHSPMADFWKGPYHTVRMYLKLLEIINNLEGEQ